MRLFTLLLAVLAIPVAAQDWEAISHGSGGPALGYFPQAVAVSADGDVAGSPTGTAFGGAFDGLPYFDARAGSYRVVETNPSRGFDTSSMVFDESGGLYLGVSRNGTVTLGGQEASGIARYDPSTDTWDALEGGTAAPSAGFDNLVYDIAIGSGGQVYLGGEFETAGGMTSNYVAAWDPASRTWDDLGGGPGDRVFALAAGGAETVFVTGYFEGLGSDPVFFARYDPDADAWQPVGRDFVGSVGTMVVDPATGTLFAGGDIRTSNSNRFKLASYDGTGWTHLSAPGPSRTVDDLAWDAASGLLYVAQGGQLYSYDPATATWSDLLLEVRGEIKGIGVGGGRVAVVGQFATAAIGPDGARVAAPGLVVYDGAGGWAGVGSSVYANSPGVGDQATALYNVDATADGASIYAAGLFEVAGDAVVNSVARWDLGTRTWNALGRGAIGSVEDVAVGNDGQVYAANAVIEGVSGSTLFARWDPSAEAWSTVPEVSGLVRRLVRTPDRRLFVTDNTSGFRLFDPAAGTVDDLEGGPPAPSGFVLNVTPAMAPDGTVYIGRTRSDSGVKADVQVFDPTARTWSALPEPTTQSVDALAVTPDGTLYLGGADPSAPRHGLLRFRDGAWESVGDVEEAVLALAVAPDGTLLAADAASNDARLFALVGDALVQWGFLDGVQSYIAPSFAFDADGGIVVGGAFRYGGEPGALTYSPHVLRFAGSLGGSTAAEAPASVGALAIAPNPTSGRTTLRLDLARAQPVRATVHDLLGRTVRVLADRDAPAGPLALDADLSGLAPGVYAVRLATADAVMTARVTVVR